MQQQNQPNQHQHSLPQKRLKKDPTLQPLSIPVSPHSNNLFCKCYTTPQIDTIISAISALQNYTKYISVLIRHQQKSLSILPKQLLEGKQFGEIGMRVSKCISRARWNNQFLGKVCKEYSEYLHDMVSVQNTDNRVTQNELTPNSILNIFTHITKQWSNLSESTKQPMYLTISLLKKHYDTSTKNIKIYVEGAGMGRIMCQIYQRLGNQDVVIEGSQDRVLHYLCGEYFLGRYRAGGGDQIYPFIHDFSNNYKTEDAYEPVTVPYWPYPVNNPNQTPSQQPQHQKQLQPSPPLYLTLTPLLQTPQKPPHTPTTTIHISYFNTDRITNILKWIQIVYKNLIEGGLWIIAFYSSFQRNVIPITYQEFRDILGKTLFQTVEEVGNWGEIVVDRGMTRERVYCHYVVLRK